MIIKTITSFEKPLLGFFMGAIFLWSCNRMDTSAKHTNKQPGLSAFFNNNRSDSVAINVSPANELSSSVENRFKWLQDDLSMQFKYVEILGKIMDKLLLLRDLKPIPEDQFFQKLKKIDVKEFVTLGYSKELLKWYVCAGLGAGCVAATGFLRNIYCGNFAQITGQEEKNQHQIDINIAYLLNSIMYCGINMLCTAGCARITQLCVKQWSKMTDLRRPSFSREKLEEKKKKTVEALDNVHTKVVHKIFFYKKIEELINQAKEQMETLFSDAYYLVEEIDPELFSLCSNQLDELTSQVDELEELLLEESEKCRASGKSYTVLCKCIGNICNINVYLKKVQKSLSDYPKVENVYTYSELLFKQ